MSVTDFHTHILPCIDDGSKSVQDSANMLQNQAEQGIKRVVAVPHFYANHDNPQRFLENREKSKKMLGDLLCESLELPEIKVGAEIYFFEGISDCEFLRKMAIEDTNCVMIEMPMKHWSERNLAELVGIYQKQNLTPIIAHVDRYVKLFTARKTFAMLSKLPVKIQVNATFFIRPMTRRLALSLLKQGKIHLIGSDCHNIDIRPPNVAQALEIIRNSLGERAISYLEQNEKFIFEQ